MEEFSTLHPDLTATLEKSNFNYFKRTKKNSFYRNYLRD